MAASSSTTAPVRTASAMHPAHPAVRRVAPPAGLTHARAGVRRRATDRPRDSLEIGAAVADRLRRGGLPSASRPGELPAAQQPCSAVDVDGALAVHPECASPTFFPFAALSSVRLFARIATQRSGSDSSGRCAVHNGPVTGWTPYEWRSTGVVGKTIYWGGAGFTHLLSNASDMLMAQ